LRRKRPTGPARLRQVVAGKILADQRPAPYAAVFVPISLNNA
jgi:hypothetical protein